MKRGWCHIVHICPCTNTLCSHENAKVGPKRMKVAAACDARPKLRRDVAYRLHRQRIRAAAGPNRATIAAACDT